MYLDMTYATNDMTFAKLRFFTVALLPGCNLGCHDPVDKVAATQNSTPGVAFLKDCKKWEDVGSGSLQAFARSRKDSAKDVCFSSYYDTTATYEITFVYKATC